MVAVLGALVVGLVVQARELPGLDQKAWQWFAPGRWQTGVLTLLVGTAAFLCYWLPRRGQLRPFSLVAGTGAVLVTVVLGLGSYWGCYGSGSSVLRPVHQTLSLFVGNVDQPFGAAGCPSQMPLALDLARLLAILTTFAGVGGLILATSRDQWDRLRARIARSVILVVGLDEDTLPLVRALATSSTTSAKTVIMEKDSNNPCVARARQAGCLIVFGDPAGRSAVASLVSPRQPASGQASSRLQAAYLLTPREDFNSELALNLADSVAEVAGRSTRVVARIDDPWLADTWARHHVVAASGALLDTTGMYRVTAGVLLDRILTIGRDRVVLLGTGMLSVAVLEEVAQLQRERASFRAPVSLHVTLMGPDARSVVTAHCQRQQVFGSYDDSWLDSFDVDDAKSIADRLGHDVWTVVDTRAPTPAGRREVEHLALTTEGDFLLRVDQVRGIARTAIVPRLWLYGLTLMHGRGAPEDRWTRLARRNHEGYLASLDDRSGTAWEELSPLLREQNIRQVSQAIAMMLEQGFSLAPELQGPPSPIEVTEEMLERFAPLEHEDWRSYYIAHGWRAGTPGGWRHNRKQNLVPWEQVHPRDRSVTIAGLRDTYAQFAGVGLFFFETMGWREVERVPLRVTATKREHGWSWRTSSETQMTAAAGDWEIVRADGTTSSITEDEFRAGYRHLEGQVFERCGRHWARPALAGEVVESSEGPEIALDGDWVVRSHSGAQWLVPAASFPRLYQILPPQAD